MPTEEESVAPIPNLEICDYVFLLTSANTTAEQKAATADSLLEAIEKDEMAPFLTHLLADSALKAYIESKGVNLLATLKQKNEEELKKLDDKLSDAQENLGETEVSDVLRSKALYLARIGENSKAIEAYQTAFDKQAGIGSKIDLRLGQIRVGFFHQDNQVITSNIQKAQDLINEGGDWDRRNRLKAYQGLHALSIRDFKKASESLLDILPTFTATELFSYNKFIEYCIITGTLSLARKDMKKKIIEAPEVIQTLPELPNLQNLTKSLYDSEYALFFQSLALVEEHHLLHSCWLYPHTRYYVREMRIKAYTQLLESYRSVTMANMADAFGIDQIFLDSDLSRFIATGRLNCSIDKVNGIIETNRPDSKNARYEQAIKQGDLLLNSIQKLSRVVGS